ncbi:Uu.00g044910.m01.CDS01 [Anthostomella pinea]|uniref:Uu.00g044910.m01.CDS01 n=1 Tax=Anthostomella pinea TaxID=933095 RepID=A0AAI8V608_9PEZI|nr:Uu.00g044910.m01.CDS01 [Anthostomella pinea]
MPTYNNQPAATEADADAGWTALVPAVLALDAQIPVPANYSLFFGRPNPMESIDFEPHHLHTMPRDALITFFERK